MRKLARAATGLVLCSMLSSLRAQDALEHVTAARAVERVEGRGFVLDSGHPKRPGDATRVAVTASWRFDPEVGEASIELVESGESPRTWFERRGRVFQVDEKGLEVAARSFGDLSAACIAALHPRSIESALRERRDAWQMIGSDGALLLAWNDALWTVDLDRAGGRVNGLSRRLAHQQYGDSTETIRFERDPSTNRSSVRTVVSRGALEVARLELGAATACDALPIPSGEEENERVRAISTSDMLWIDVAPHLHSIDIAVLNLRITVAEFTDYCVVLEGAYSSRICDLVARAVEERLKKPIRYFAFSHLHGQYIGGVRSFVHAGATVLVPATTAPLVEKIVAAAHTLCPDALSMEPKALKVQVVKDRLRLEDGTNTLDVLLVDSAHTDEYLVFHFPRQKVLLSGDLLFLREGKGLTGRSKLFAETAVRLGLEFDTVRCTWPLDGFGTKNVVTRAELIEALAAAK